MATSFIGKAISLLSHSDVRYRGILAGLDPSSATIQLRNVFSMGTENRRPPEEFIPPADQPYQYIIFRASEVKDIALDGDQPPMARTRSVTDDPAVMSTSGPPPPVVNGAYGQYFPQNVQNGITPPPPAQQVPPNLGVRTPSGQQQVPSGAPQAAPAVDNDRLAQPQGQASGRTSSNSRRGNNSVSNADASLEKVERALGDLRLSNAQSRNRRGGQRTHEVKVPSTDFDFASSNARFDKAALGGRTSTNGEDSDANTNPSEEEGEVTSPKKEKESAPAYNPKSSFFDQLSSNNVPAGPRGGGRGGRRGGGKSRREEEREKNVATFGEPGGVGLLGPGAYVGGYGGGRRGGGRGGGRRRNPHHAATGKAGTEQ